LATTGYALGGCFQFTVPSTGGSGGWGNGANSVLNPGAGSNGTNGIGYGSGGSGATMGQSSPPKTGGSGTNGIIIVEEFY
jgi:hypothetical protein